MPRAGVSPRWTRFSAAAGWSEEPAAGVHADQRPRVVVESATAAIPIGGRDEHGQRVPQLVAGVADLSKRVGGKLDQPGRALLACPGQVFEFLTGVKHLR